MKTKVWILLVIYFLTRIGQSWSSRFQSDTFAQLKKSNTPVVVLLVDSHLYANNQLEQKIKRYAQDYIQSKITNSKAIVVPFDVSKINSRDIVRLLENLYFEGVQNSPSSLEGVILIGDKVPLPIVDDEGAIFPTILPYTDFEDPKYYRDPSSQYFLPNGVDLAQAEIWHSIINVGSQASDYVEYFSKLQNYAKHPDSYVSRRVRYDDFIDQKQSFNNLNLGSYVNNFLFAEDLAYHRYNPLLIDFFNAKNDDQTKEIVNTLEGSSSSSEYAQQVGQVFDELSSELSGTTTSSADEVPTVFVDDVLEGFVKPYHDLYGASQSARMRDNILSAARWTTDQMDSHATKIAYVDQLYLRQLGQAQVPLLAELNKKFEDALTKAVSDNDYAMYVALPLNAKIQKNKITAQRNSDPDAAEKAALLSNTPYYDAGIYEAFFYGRNVSSITGLHQTSIFLGDHNPLEYDLTRLAHYTGYTQDTSIGSSQGILAQLVEANRGYNVMKGPDDLDLKMKNNICGKDGAGMDQYVQGFLGGNTPLNLTGTDQGLELMDKRYDRGGLSNRALENSALLQDDEDDTVASRNTGALLDVAGSRRVPQPLDWMYAENMLGGYLQRVAYTHVKKRSFVGSILGSKYKKKVSQVDTCDDSQTDSEPLTAHNLYALSGLTQTGYQKIISLGDIPLITTGTACGPQEQTGSLCFPLATKPKIPSGQFVQIQTINYKLIDSTLIHDAPNSEQVSQLTNITPARPIDQTRRIGFLGIGGQRVDFEYPNLYAVPIYKLDTAHPERLLLKSKSEIAQSIRDYLSGVVVSYNALLSGQLAGSADYYTGNKSIFDKLALVDVRATPQRNYTFLPQDFFNTLISDEIVDALANLLYTENSLYLSKTKTTNLLEEYDQLAKSVDINAKKDTIVNDYLTIQQPRSPLSLPGYIASGYELIAITSDGNDGIINQENPSRVLETQSKRAGYDAYQSAISQRNQRTADLSSPGDDCAAPYGEPVPLFSLKPLSFPRFTVFACRIERLSAPKVTFSFPNAQGPVFIDKAFKDFLSPSTSGSATGGISSVYMSGIQPSTPTLSVTEKSLADKISFGLSTPTYSLQDDVPLDLRPVLTLTQKSNPETLKLSIRSTGAVCVVVDGVNTCQQEYTNTITDANYISPYLLPDKPNVGTSMMTVKICQSTTCVSKDLLFMVTPGSLHKASIITPSDFVLSQSKIPLHISGVDRFGNQLSLAIPPVSISSSKGEFGAGLSGYSFSNLNENIQFSAPATSNQEQINLTILDTNHTTLANKTLTVYSGHLSFSSYSDSFSRSNTRIDYTLPNQKSQVYLANGYINTKVLPNLSLQLLGPNNKKLSGPVLVYSQNGLITPYQLLSGSLGSIVSHQALSSAYTLIFDGEHPIDLVFLPKDSNNIGSDIIYFQFPDESIQSLPIIIRPAERPSQIDLQTSTTQTLLDNKKQIDFSVQVLDDRENPTTTADSTLSIDTFGALNVVGSGSLVLVQGKGSFSAITSENGGPAYVRVRNNSDADIIPALWTRQVKQSFLPQDNINGLYLSLMGAGRGNTQDPQRDYYDTVPTILNNSKVLVSTTELIDPQEVPLTILRIKNDGSLSGSQINQWVLVRTGTQVLAQNPSLRTQVVLGQTQNWSRSQNLLTAKEIYPESNNFSTRVLPANGSSSSEKMIAIVDNTLSYRPTTTLSIETAADPNLNTAWRNKQHHLVQFAQGQSVGEATKYNASEFLINYGDPLITRISDNTPIVGSDFDAGPGQLVVNSTKKTIKKSFSLDVNGDGLPDLVTVFTDGSVIWSKQYGGRGGADPIFEDMGPLLNIYGGIKDVFGADSYGDNFGDIIVQTSQDDLRIYTNTNGIFEVDGFPICINATQKDNIPERIDDIDQRFIKDMDKDGRSDIVLNKGGEIVVIYGSSSSAGHSYISRSVTNCDAERSSRQKKQKHIVDHLATTLTTGTVVDNSLIRRKGLIQTDDDAEDTLANQLANDLSSTKTIGESPAQMLTKIKGINPLKKLQILNDIKKSGVNTNAGLTPDFGSIDFDGLVSHQANSLLRRSVSPIDFLPSYETLDSKSIRYIVASELQAKDQVKVEKSYHDLNGGVLQAGDEVTVTVRISGPRNEPLTYIDRISGPWSIAFSDGVISGWNQGTLPTTARYHGFNPQSDFYFLVDNITLGSRNSVQFSYRLKFQGDAPIKIAINDRNNDDYLDISAYPLDACSKFLWTYYNTKSSSASYRAYRKEFNDIGSKLKTYAETSQSSAQNYISSINNAVTNSDESSQALSVIDGISSEQMSFGNLFENVIGNGGHQSFNLNVTLLGDFDKRATETIQRTLDSICSGGPATDNSCRQGLPVPFNMAFLSPGEYNIMGCKPNFTLPGGIFPKDNGFPAFAFPANLGPLPFVGYLPLPFPRGGLQKGPTDSYGYFGFPPKMGPYSSQIRIYLSPTLTQQLGVAICFGPQVAGNKIPLPFSALGGNCIVTKASLGSSSCEMNDIPPEKELSDQDILDLSQFGQCTQNSPSSSGGSSSARPSTPQSPFKLTAIDIQGKYYDPFPSGTYLGIINFEKKPIVVTDDIEDSGVILKGGKPIYPQLQGGASKGMVACIVDNWIDRQTNYIVNNLTNMQIGIYLPDFSQLGEGFSTLSSQLENFDSSKLSLTSPLTSASSSTNDYSGNLISTIRNNTISKSELANFSQPLNNPFEQIQKLFQQTPLIHIQTQDVVVNIPMIYSEDINRYETELNSRIERNKATASDRSTLIQAAFGICGKSYDLQSIVSSSAPSLESSNTPRYTLSSQAWKDLSTNFNSTKTQLEQALTSAESCQTSKWKKEGSCKNFMDKFGLSSESDGKVFMARLQNNIEISNQCLNLVSGEELDGRLENMITIISQMETREAKIRENIKVLDEYKRFPLQLYQWIHVTDRYLAELTDMVKNFLGYLNTWLNTNSTRFEQYVDAIITISNALQTWQALLNLSTERQRKCGNCTVDSYDSYACSLGSLCGALKLPILRIPPFKIPNIYIDMSHIDLGMDIVLPNFQFVPQAIDLPSLPDLPQPPSIALNPNLLDSKDVSLVLKEFVKLAPAQVPLSLPEIPLLPQPPTLPELPSYIPTINMELPILPPAPSIPRIAPDIEVAIKAVSFFSKLYCIIKGPIGLVAESNVKSRIEQLTQRTWSIPLFDSINLTKDMSYQQDKLEGFDFKIDAFVNFNLNFKAVYDLIQGLANQINDYTKVVTKWNGSAQIASKNLQEIIDTANSTTQQNINILNPFGSTADESNLVALNEEKNVIKQVNNYMMGLEETPQSSKTILQDIIDSTTQEPHFIPQKQALAQVGQKAHQSFEAARHSLSTLTSRLEDYDQFIDSLSVTGKQITLMSGEAILEAPLFENSAGIQLPQQSLMTDYIALQKKLLSNYDKGLYQIRNADNEGQVNKIREEIAYLDEGLDLTNKVYNHDPYSPLQLAQLKREDYDALEMLSYNNQAMMCSPSGTEQGREVLNAYPTLQLTAQTSPSSSVSVPSYDMTNLYDFRSYGDKLMIPSQTASGTIYTDVIQSDYFNEASLGYEVSDLNADHQDDIIHRSHNQVRIKYAKQRDSHLSSSHHKTTTKYYETSLRTAADDWDRRSDKDGYLKLSDTSFKVASPHLSVKNLKTISQDYDSFTVSWTNSERQQAVDGYLLQVTTVPESYQLKAEQDLPSGLRSRYVLLLPEQEFTEDGLLAVSGLIKAKKLSQLVDDATLIAILPYQKSADRISYSFTQLPRKRYYIRVASIQSNHASRPLFTLGSTRSHGVVAGQQLIADDVGPLPTVRLIREKTNGTIDEGVSLEGLVNTSYRLEIERDDPSGVLNNQIQNESGLVISDNLGSRALLKNLYFDSPQQIKYTIKAMDGRNNLAQESLLLTIGVPTIHIEDIVENMQSPGGLSIISQLSKGLDDGLVKFERKRGGQRTTLKNPASHENQGFVYSLGLDQTTISGGVYNQSKEIEFYDNADNKLFSIGKDGGEISVAPSGSGRVAIAVDFSAQTPRLLLSDATTKTTLFSIVPQTKNTSFDPIYPYSLQSLSGPNYGSFAGGQCVMDQQHHCLVLIDKGGNIFIPNPYHTQLKGSSYHFNNGITSFRISQSDGSLIGTISFTMNLP